VKPYYFLFSLLFQVCFLAATLNQPGPAETSQRQPAEHTPLLSPAAGRAHTTALSNSQQYCTLQQSTETTGRSPATSKFWSQQLPPAASPLQPLHFPSGNAASSLQLLKFPSGITDSSAQPTPSTSQNFKQLAGTHCCQPCCQPTLQLPTAPTTATCSSQQQLPAVANCGSNPAASHSSGSFNSAYDSVKFPAQNRHATLRQHSSQTIQDRPMGHLR